MNAQKLKDYILEDSERIVKVLESIGCHRIWFSGDEIRCAPPESDNNTAVSVNLTTLYSRYFNRTETVRGDLIVLVQHIRNESFTDTFRYLKSLFGLSGKYVKDEKVDPLALFKSIRKQSKVVKDIEEVEISKFGLETLEDFVMMPHINLFYEGIMPETQELFRVGYDPQLDRIIFPHANYDNPDVIVGITGRTTRSKEEMDQLCIPKYWNYLKGYLKTYNLYGFCHSVENIAKSNMLVIFEAEKSVLKQFTMTRNKGFSCALGGHELTDVQVQILLKNTPIDTEIVIAFDKDIMEDEEFLIRTCNKISKYRKTSYIMDTDDLLSPKDSPIDKGIKIFHQLLEGRKFV